MLLPLNKPTGPIDRKSGKALPSNDKGTYYWACGLLVFQMARIAC